MPWTESQNRPPGPSDPAWRGKPADTGPLERRQAGAIVAVPARVGRLRALLLLVLLFGRTDPAVAAPRARNPRLFSGAGWRAPNGVRVPLGLKPELFTRLLDHVRSHEAFADAEAVVLYGSRTHHGYGYAPTPTSDLDVRVYWKGSAKQHHQTVGKAARANGVLAPIGEAAGFPISQQIIKFAELDENLAPGSAIDFTPHSRAAERAMWERLVAEGARPRDEMKFAFQKKVSRAAGWDALGKEALILLREGPATAERLQQLQARDYRNVIVLSAEAGAHP
jgi:hypothetical protein